MAKCISKRKLITTKTPTQSGTREVNIHSIFYPSHSGYWRDIRTPSIALKKELEGLTRFPIYDLWIAMEQLRALEDSCLDKAKYLVEKQ